MNFARLDVLSSQFWPDFRLASAKPLPRFVRIGHPDRVCKIKEGPKNKSKTIISKLKQQERNEKPQKENETLTHRHIKIEETVFFFKKKKQTIRLRTQDNIDTKRERERERGRETRTKKISCKHNRQLTSKTRPKATNTTTMREGHKITMQMERRKHVRSNTTRNIRTKNSNNSCVTLFCLTAYLPHLAVSAELAAAPFGTSYGRKMWRHNTISQWSCVQCCCLRVWHTSVL